MSSAKSTVKKIVKILRQIPYLMMPGPIPPLAVINDVAAKGEYAAGMSGYAKWKPFQLTECEYIEVVAELVRQVKGLVKVEVPDSVKTHSEWSRWKIVRTVGDKGGELEALLIKQAEVNDKISALSKDGNNAEIEQLRLEQIDLSFKVSDMILALRNK